jgi:hypothetical protein
MKKLCTGCNTEKEEDKFPPKKSKCRDCLAAYARRYYANRGEAPKGKTITLGQMIELNKIWKPTRLRL